MKNITNTHIGIGIIAGIVLLIAIGTINLSSITGCSDTDGGKNFAVKGTVDVWGTKFTDFCPNPNEIKEYYCNIHGQASVASKDCNCIDGACTDIQCTPGTYKCEDNRVMWCNDYEEWIMVLDCNDYVNKQCICDGNDCNCRTVIITTTIIPVQTYCTDTDGTIDYYTAGTVTVYENNELIFLGNDNCVGNTLVEYFCGANLEGVVEYHCPYGCESGACKLQPTTTTTITFTTTIMTTTIGPGSTTTSTITPIQCGEHEVPLKLTNGTYVCICEEEYERDANDICVPAITCEDNEILLFGNCYDKTFVFIIFAIFGSIGIIALFTRMKGKPKIIQKIR